MEDKDGVWRTIRGRRIFIASGQSLGEAMKKSGKFNRRDVQNAKKDLRFDDRQNKVDKLATKTYKKYDNADIKGFRKNLRNEHKAYNKLRAKEDEDTYYTEMYNSTEASKKPIEINTKGKTRVERYKSNYSEREQKELSHEALQKKLADYRQKKGIKTSITSEEYNEKMNNEFKKWQKGEIDTKEYLKRGDDIMDNYTTPRIEKEATQKANEKAIADFKAKKQSNRSFDNKFIEEAKALNDRDSGKISEEEYYKRLAKINGEDYEKMIEKIKENVDRLGVERPDFLKDKQSNNKIEKLDNSEEDREIKGRMKELQREIASGRNDKEKTERLKEELSQYESKYGKQSNYKVDPYNDPESNESQRLQSIQSRYDDYLQDTEGRGASYGEIAYVDSLRGKDLDDFEKELDDYEAKKFDKQDKAEKIKAYKEKKKSNNHDTTNRILESGKVNQKTLKSYAKDGLATDISDYSDKELDKLEKKHGKIRAIKTTNGVYGMNGGLFRGEKSGEYFVITSRSGNLYRLV